MKNKILTALLSLIVAYGLWLYVINVIHPNYEDTFYNIPVVLTNEAALSERNLMVTTESVPTVTLRLSGNRSDLLQLNSGNISIQASLSGIYEAGEHLLSYQIYYPGNFPGNAFDVISQTPVRISLNVERRERKEVPVVLSFVGNISDDFMCDTQNPVMDYDVVTVDGPSPVISQIQQAKIEIDLTDRTQSIAEAFRYTLCDGNGEPVELSQVQTDVGEINVTVKIQRIKEIPLRLTVIPGGGATESTSDIHIEPSSIRVSGSDAALAELNEINLGTINLGELTQPMVNQTYPIKLPDNVTNLTSVTEAAVSVRFPNLSTVNLRVTDIRLINVPADTVAELVAKELQVTLRGPSTLISSLRASDVYAMVDLTGVPLGTSTVRANIFIAPGYENAGAVGSYSVSVNVKDAEEAANETTGPGT